MLRFHGLVKKPRCLANEYSISLLLYRVSLSLSRVTSQEAPRGSRPPRARYLPFQNATELRITRTAESSTYYG